MGYARAGWHSGLTYRQTCEQCKTTVEYMDDKLGYRPWFADGFIYCPTCQKPLRHREEYALSEVEPRFVDMKQTVGETTNEAEQQDNAVAYCTQCGKRFREGDRFCSGCGTKRS